MVRSSIALALTALVTFSACAVVEQDDSLARRRANAPPGVPGSTSDGPSSVETSDEGLDDDTVPDVNPPEVEGEGETNGAPSLAAAVVPPIVLYVNGKGARMSPGQNDSSRNTSQIVKGTTDFPASKYVSDAARWGRLMDTVRTHFAKYNVSVVDVEPTAPPYLEVVITNGAPSLIGYGDSLGGIAPTRCGVVSTSVAFVFDRRMSSEIAVAETVSHELGHSLSLSHTQTPTDLMSYSNDGERFENVDAKCGPTPSQPQSCNCGGSTQNNHEQLLQFVGAAAAAPPATPPPTGTTPPATPPPPPTPPAADGSVTLLSPANGSSFTPGQPLVVKADGSKVAGLTRMDLYWRIGSRTYVYGCPSSQCTVSNGTYSWRMVPGTGTRVFRVRGTDSAGKTYDSATHQIMSQ